MTPVRDWIRKKAARAIPAVPASMIRTISRTMAPRGSLPVRLTR